MRGREANAEFLKNVADQRGAGGAKPPRLFWKAYVCYHDQTSPQAGHAGPQAGGIRSLKKTGKKQQTLTKTNIMATDFGKIPCATTSQPRQRRGYAERSEAEQ